MLTHALVAITLLSISALPEPQTDHPLQAHLDDAERLRDVFTSPQAQQMLDEVTNLPVDQPKTVYAAFRPNRGYTAEQYEQLTEQEQEQLRKIDISPADYYATFYGSPLVYARVLDLLHTHAPEFTVQSAKIMDLGYGQLGQLRLWAQMNADVTGVEIDPILTAIYTDSKAVGDIDNDPETPGSITLIEGSWPNNQATRTEVGSGYDLIISRNLLKRGYVKPATLNPNYPIPVGWEMPDDEVIAHFYDTLCPGGFVIIESLGPKPDPAKPWSDISNPWAEQSWIDAGFKVIAHDQDESEYARTMGAALRWDDQMDLESDLFAVYSIYQRPINTDSIQSD